MLVCTCVYLLMLHSLYHWFSSDEPHNWWVRNLRKATRSPLEVKKRLPFFIQTFRRTKMHPLHFFFSLFFLQVLPFSFSCLFFCDEHHSFSSFSIKEFLPWERYLQKDEVSGPERETRALMQRPWDPCNRRKILQTTLLVPACLLLIYESV